MILKNLRHKIYNILKIKKKTNYANYEGSLNLYNQILWAILFFGRTYYRFIGNTLFFFQKKFKKKYYNLDSDNLNFEKIFETFKKDGCVVIPNYFTEIQIENFKREYNDEIKKIKEQSKSLYPKASHCEELLVIRNLFEKLFLDKNLIGLIKNFSSDMVYARNYPYMVFSSNFPNQVPTKNIVEKSKFANNWHIDHSNLFNLHILLEDVTENDLCMEYIPGSHKLLNMPLLYSDEEIENLKNYKIRKCFGRKGTVYIHYGNTLHRMFTVANSTRLQLHLEFTSKTNILYNSSNVAYTLSENYDLDKLEPDLRYVLSGIFPLSHHKGYNILKKNNFEISSNKIT